MSSSPREVHPIAGANVDPQLQNTLAYRRDISRVP